MHFVVSDKYTHPVKTTWVSFSVKYRGSHTPEVAGIKGLQD